MALLKFNTAPASTGGGGGKILGWILGLGTVVALGYFFWWKPKQEKEAAEKAKAAAGQA